VSVRASFSENKGDRGEGAAEKGKRESLLSTAISGNICCRTPLDLILFRSLSLPSPQPRPCFIALSFCGVCKVQSASPSPPAFCALTHTHINAIHTRPIAPPPPPSNSTSFTIPFWDCLPYLAVFSPKILQVLN